jgi:hypothetical protein
LLNKQTEVVKKKQRTAVRRALVRLQRERSLFCISSLTPSEHSSGEKTKRGDITRQGAGRLRPILVEAAWRAIKIDPIHSAVPNKNIAAHAAFQNSKPQWAFLVRSLFPPDELAHLFHLNSHPIALLWVNRGIGATHAWLIDNLSANYLELNV